ncbi:MAG: hypothetical protein GX126_14740, partial [Bacteroidales bacterium]|nr:hypothetical protein [Bacteroidales bacterium]
RWLLTGEGSMFNESNIDNISSQRPVEVKSEPDVLYGTGQKIPQNDEKQVQKLILLNSDGTFTIYREDQSKQ